MSNIFNPSDADGKLFSGSWIAATRVIDVVEPATGEVLLRTGSATPEEVRRAAQSAREAQVKWAAMDYKERAAIFRRGRCHNSLAFHIYH